MKPEVASGAAPGSHEDGERRMARELSQWSGRTLIAAHLRPDGDAVGAAFGLAHCLVAAGHDAVCVSLAPISDIYDFLVREAPPCLAEPPLDPMPGDRLVVVDAGDASRLPKAVQPLADGRIPVLCIDHHERSGGFASSPFSLVESDAGSASEIVFRVCEKAGFPIPRAAADAFWTGIVTDTGRFGYDSTSEATLLAASRLVALGARVRTVSESVYGTVPLRRLRLQTRFMQSLEVVAGGAVAIGCLSAADYAEEKCSDVDSENFVDIARSVRGCRLAAFVRQVSPDRPVNVSLRALPPHDVAEICAEWGGGGHKAAAGATLRMPLAGAVSFVRERLVKAAAET